jgi:hypothetical protein
MIRRCVLALLVLGTLSDLAPHVQAQFALLALPSPGEVIGLIDTLTKSESSTTVDVKFGQTVSQGKLLVARTKVDVAMDRSSRNWRGRVFVHMSVPTEISYSVDLTSLRTEHIRIDPQHRRLTLLMPEPRVEDVTPLLSGVKTEDRFKAARFRFCDKDTSRELQNAMLLHDYQARARQVGEAAAPQVRGQARETLQLFLQLLLRGTAPDVQVEVE